MVLCKTDVRKAPYKGEAGKPFETSVLCVVVLYCYNVSRKNKYNRLCGILASALAEGPKRKLKKGSFSKNALTI
jgi:hypothetical protein